MRRTRRCCLLRERWLSKQEQAKMKRLSQNILMSTEEVWVRSMVKEAHKTSSSWRTRIARSFQRQTNSSKRLPCWKPSFRAKCSKSDKQVAPAPHLIWHPSKGAISSATTCQPTMLKANRRCYLSTLEVSFKKATRTHHLARTTSETRQWLRKQCVLKTCLCTMRRSRFKLITCR